MWALKTSNYCIVLLHYYKCDKDERGNEIEAIKIKKNR